MQRRSEIAQLIFDQADIVEGGRLAVGIAQHLGNRRRVFVRFQGIAEAASADVHVADMQERTGSDRGFAKVQRSIVLLQRVVDPAVQLVERSEIERDRGLVAPIAGIRVDRESRPIRLRCIVVLTLRGMDAADDVEQTRLTIANVHLAVEREGFRARLQCLGVLPVKTLEAA